MSKENKLIPELRFPEFENDGEWVEKKLGDITENLDSKRIPITSTQREKGSVAYYGASGIIDYVKDYIFDETLLCISEDGANLIDRNYPIAFTISGKTWVNNHSHVLRFENFDTQILVEKYINSINIQDFLTGMAQPKLNRGKLDIIPIPLPKNPKEQQKIASCLSSLDEIIATHSQKLNLLKDHKKGMMQNLFPQEGEKVPKYRFKEFENDGEWVEKSLEYLTIKIGDGIHTTPKYDPSGKYYFINGNNLIEGKIVVDEKTKRVSSEEFEIHKKHLTKKTIFLSINGTIGNLAFYNNEMVVLGKSACYITPSQKLNNVFLYYSLQSPRINDYFISELTGSTIKNLSLKSIRETAIHLPSEIEQQKIASCLSSLDALITSQTERIEQLKLHKKGLMQGLFPKIEI
jgi:type I restriction enzyme S subunit